jgi:hypothetical protein
MIEEVNVVVKPSESADIEKLKLLAAAETNRELGNINHIEIPYKLER